MFSAVDTHKLWPHHQPIIDVHPPNGLRFCCAVLGRAVQRSAFFFLQAQDDTRCAAPASVLRSPPTMSTLLSYARSTMQYVATTYADEGAAEGAGECPLSAALNAALAALPAHEDLRVPKLVVVGTQSSGKSSLINALIGVQLLPTGEQMTTRAAIHTELRNTALAPDGTCRAEVGHFDDGAWRAARSVVLSDPPTDEQQRAVVDAIQQASEAQLDDVAGVAPPTSKVHLRLCSPRVPNLAFVDLPGITMTALTAAGQPADICAQIRRLIATHVDERTIVLLVCAARPDLEADAAMELVKQLTGGARTIGCLTKVDLCENVDGILPYLRGEQCRDLALEHGFFAVCTRCARGESMATLAQQEAAFFRASSLGGLPNVGLKALGARVRDLNSRHLRQALPALRRELVTLDEDARSRYREHVTHPVPSDDVDRMALAVDMVCTFCSRAQQRIGGKHPGASMGRVIREMFACLRDTVRRSNPFDDASTYTDDEIAEAAHNCQGWSMISPAPPVAIVEFFMQHRDHRPIATLLRPCVACAENVFQDLASALVDECDAHFGRFGNFLQWMQDELATIVAQARADVCAAIANHVRIQEAYVFTDDPTFARDWAAATCKANACCSGYAALIRSILGSYFAVVSAEIASVVPKLIVAGITTMLEGMHTLLGQRLHVSDVRTLLLEADETEALRRRLSDTMSASGRCIAAIDEALAKPPYKPG